jgi:thioredoxin reductase (NADPH)
MSSPEVPFILAVDDDLDAIGALERDLTRRFSSDYRIVVERSAEAGLQQLQHLRNEGADVALIIAGFHLHGKSGIDLLIEAHRLHPDARRVLMIVFGEAATADNEIARARALGQIDSYITKPWGAPEVFLYAGLTELLSEWAQTHLPQFEVVRLVGPRHSSEAHHLRDILDRNPVRYGFYPDDSVTGRELLQEHSLSEGQLPAAIFADGRILRRPSTAEIADAIGAKTRCPTGLFDVAVIGAGPAGLAAAVYGTSEGLRTVVLEAEAVGGQAGTSSMIRNYLGFPRGISGRALATRAFQQSTQFGVDIIFMNRAIGLSTEGPHHVVFSSDGSQITARTVVVATGVRYCRLDIPEVEPLLGAGVFYGAGGSEAQAMRDRRVFVVGAGNSAGQAAIHLAKYASQVTMLVRGDSLAKSMSDYLIQEIADKPNIEVRLQTQVTGARGRSYLEALELRDGATGETRMEPADGLFVLIGAEPHTGWLPDRIERDEKGYILTGRDLSLDCGCERNLPATWPLQREPYLLETSVPGVFAAGDVRYRSMKRVASAVGEGSTAISLIHQYLSAGSGPERASSTDPAHICERHRLVYERRSSHA